MTTTTVTITVETTQALLTAYKAERAAQDGVTVSDDQAINELLVIGKYVKTHGNRFSSQ